MGYIVHHLECPKPRTILLVHELTLSALEQLAEGNEKFSSDDDPTDAKRVFTAIKRPPLATSRFACMTPFIRDNFHARHVTASYSMGDNLALILDFESVRGDMIVLNGDLGRLGKALENNLISDSFISAVEHPESSESLSSKLELLYGNMMANPPKEPRIYGNSFEARLFRGIKPTDVKQVFIKNADDGRAISIATRLGLHHRNSQA